MAIEKIGEQFRDYSGNLMQLYRVTHTDGYSALFRIEHSAMPPAELPDTQPTFKHALVMLSTWNGSEWCHALTIETTVNLSLSAAREKLESFLEAFCV